MDQQSAPRGEIVFGLTRRTGGCVTEMNKVCLQHGLRQEFEQSHGYEFLSAVAHDTAIYRLLVTIY